MTSSPSCVSKYFCCVFFHALFRLKLYSFTATSYSLCACSRAAAAAFGLASRESVPVVVRTVPTPTLAFTLPSSRLTAAEASMEMSLLSELLLDAASLSPRASGSVPATLAVFTSRSASARISTVPASTLRFAPRMAWVVRSP